MRTTIIFDNFGPYHQARLRAYARVCALTAVQVSASSAEYAWENEVREEGFDMVTLFPQATSDHAAAREVVNRMRAVLNDSRPEVVVVPGWSTRPALAALGWCSRHGVPAVIMSESTAWDEMRSEWRETIKRRIVTLCAAVLVGGRPQADYVVQLGLPPDRVFYGYDAVDNAYFRQKADEVRKQGAAIRINNGLPENYFLASARFIEKKNLPRLLQAYARYRALCGRDAGERPEGNASPPWSLVLLGDGELRASLCSQIAGLLLQDHVLLPGFKQYRDLPFYYAFAGAFIHASTTEQWGLVVNEAMASGLPVLVSVRCGCAYDLVQNGRNGFIFDPLDVEGLARLMYQMSSMTTEARNAMGAKSEAIIAEWSPNRFAEGLELAARKALAAGPLRRGTWLDRLLWQGLLVVPLTPQGWDITNLLMKLADHVFKIEPEQVFKKEPTVVSVKADEKRLLIFGLGRRNILAMPAHPHAIYRLGAACLLAHTPKRRLYQNLILASFLLGVQRIFSYSVPITNRAAVELDYERWLTMLREKIGKADLKAVLVWPRQSTRERIYIHVFDEWLKACAFVKVGKKIEDQPALDNGFNALVELAAFPYRQIRLPRPLTHGIFDGYPFFIQEPLPPNASPPKWRPDKDISPLLRELCPEGKRLQVGEIMQLSWWKNYTGSLPPGSELFHQELLAQLARGADVGRVHGDFSTANMAIEGKHVWLFDWESTHSQGPILTDAVGYFLSFAVGKIIHHPGHHVRRFVNKFLNGGDPQRRLDVMLALAYRHSCGLPDAQVYMRRFPWRGLG